MNCPVSNQRVRVLNNKPVQESREFVLYWMQAAVRLTYNYALQYAVFSANQLGKPLLICFGLTESFPEANARHYAFLLEGLQDVQRQLAERKLSMVVFHSEPEQMVEKLFHKAVQVVVDMNYLRVTKNWRQRVASNIDCSFIQVETECVVPVELVTDKEEYAARTIRPKLWKHANKFLIPWADTIHVENQLVDIPQIDELTVLDLQGEAKELVERLNVDKTVPPVSHFVGGETEAKRRLAEFCRSKLRDYEKKRNDPSLNCVSHMSPYLHFGHISPVEIVCQVQQAQASKTCKDAFIEEVFIRRELSFNFCYYCDKYDAFDCLPTWAKQTMSEHSKDPRQFSYTLEQLETAVTHDPYWNAAQLEMVQTGKMHNYMRMYWGKKVIEWTTNPEEAFRILLYLNNKYELDGRDPNSFTGVAWCFGKHDRAHMERPITGKLRYMSAEGLRRKFNIESYVRQYLTSNQQNKILSVFYGNNNNNNPHKRKRTTK
ncbi:deoxyribodipyrimidine photo-lyase isoform 1 [Galdieria sulphuraria]|uniref:Deoxyribodipyrimidine photo-lyase n=1 Tax=Galdieria sulphuraria TaxID=130081 RepID=M2XU09_GALSU|nr:deoxyribodipyrimidine photo-lyase isoform 1 [Galdieria sulphuraria]EME26894.1 deoxyribodipyrimidine photo-lyase isoform 1 [Galdieria sulphuraria]|eukprot:XP_005703414.1 deoxyribodipyrimidine photo-lyase isoform 1 [Galdieria sulphuraria]